MNKQQGKIDRRRANIPRIHRKTYDKAMHGKSLRSAVKAFCLECVCWQKEEVRACTDYACPLYPYRPYKESPKQAFESVSFATEPKKLNKGGNYAG